MKDVDFTGKTAVVTGAASGMGLMTSQEFARRGAKVIMCDHDEVRLRQEVEELKSGGLGELSGQVVPCVGDVRKFAYAEEAAKIAAVSIMTVEPDADQDSSLKELAELKEGTEEIVKEETVVYIDETEKEYVIEPKPDDKKPQEKTGATTASRRSTRTSLF